MMKSKHYAETPCEWCGWKFKGFHICLKLSKEIMQRVEDGGASRRRKEANGISLPEKRANRESSVMRDRDPYRVRRNREIVGLYNDGKTIKEIKQKLGIDEKIVMNVLHRAADDGDVTIRRAVRRTAVG